MESRISRFSTEVHGTGSMACLRGLHGFGKFWIGILGGLASSTIARIAFGFTRYIVMSTVHVSLARPDDASLVISATSSVLWIEAQAVRVQYYLPIRIPLHPKLVYP